MLIEYAGKRPTIDPTAWVAPDATVCGDVTIGPGVRILHDDHRQGRLLRARRERPGRPTRTHILDAARRSFHPTGSATSGEISIARHDGLGLLAGFARQNRRSELATARHRHLRLKFFRPVRPTPGGTFEF